MTYELDLQPGPVATLATLAYEELSSNYTKLNQTRPLDVISEEEVVNRTNTQETYTIKIAHAKTKANIDFSEKRMKLLLDKGLGKMDWQDSKKSLEENPNTILVRRFYYKFKKELKNKEKARKNKESNDVIPTMIKGKKASTMD